MTRLVLYELLRFLGIPFGGAIGLSYFIGGGRRGRRR